MLFNSIPFFFFLISVVGLFNVLPQKARPILLLIAGYSFYALNECVYLLWLVLVTIISYLGGLLVGNKKRKSILATSIISVLMILFFFKYSNFAITVYNDFSSVLGGNPLDPLDLLIPVGISFYTFVAVGYLIDIY